MLLARTVSLTVAALSFLAGSTPAAAQERAGIGALPAALARAEDGDTVVVGAGTHAGPFTIERPIVLRGEPGAVLHGSGKGTVLTVRADSVTVVQLTVRGSGSSLDRDEAAIRIEHCSGCRLERVSIDSSLHGVYLVETSGSLLADNVIRGNTRLTEARRGNGIHLFNSGGNHVLRNHISGTRDGIYFSFASRNTIDSNVVTRVRYGLHYMYSNDNSFTANRFFRNAAGAAIMFSDRIVLSGNEFTEHLGYRAYGLLLQTARDVLVERNTVSGNLIGVFLDNSNEILLRDNRITGNGIGIDLLPSAYDNTFTRNSFAANRTPVRIARGSGKSTWSVNGQGNYWGRGISYDLDGDGTGDEPYEVGDAFATLAQSRPSIEVFAGTPAARALSWAEEAFPAFQNLRVEDPAPLMRFEDRVSDAGRAEHPVLAGIAGAGTLLIFSSLLLGRRRAHRTRQSAASVQEDPQHPHKQHP